jgi:micrococcal nuclease
VTTWTVPGAISRVVDGDSLHVNLDLGWGVWRRDAMVRLAGIDAPELSTPQGRTARTFLEVLIGELPAPCTVVSHSMDKYGRVLASVALQRPGAPVTDLSSAMLTAGHARAWDGHGPRPGALTPQLEGE